MVILRLMLLVVFGFLSVVEYSRHGVAPDRGSVSAGRPGRRRGGRSRSRRRSRTVRGRPKIGQREKQKMTPTAARCRRIQLVGQTLKISKPVGVRRSGSSSRMGGPPAPLSRNTTVLPGGPISSISLPASLRCSWFTSGRFKRNEPLATTINWLSSARSAADEHVVARLQQHVGRLGRR